MSTPDRPALHRRQFLAGAAAAAVWPGLASAQGDLPAPLGLGLVPYLSTRSMIAVFDPLRAHLERTLGVPVTTFTASNLRTFGEQLRDGRYHLAFAPIHFMRLAELEWKQRIVAQVRAPSRIVIVTRKGAGIRVPADLAGKRIVSLDRLAITSMKTLDYLAAHGLRPGVDLVIEFLVTATTSLRALENPAVDALALIDTQLPEFPPEVRETIEVALDVGEIPPPGYVASLGLGAAGVERVARALTAFDGTADGRGSLSRSPIVASTLAASEPAHAYALQLKQLLG